MVHTKGFYIVSPGDYSVGIIEANWTINGDFYFEDKDQLEGFRAELMKAFEYVADPIGVETIEELMERIDAENAMMNSEQGAPVCDATEDDS